MQKRKMCIKRMVSLWLLLITVLVLSSCGNMEEDSFGKVISVKEICSRIQNTNANITEDKINTLLEKNKEKSGEYRIDSDAYPDAFQYKIMENKETSFFLAGIVK